MKLFITSLLAIIFALINPTFSQNEMEEITSILLKNANGKDGKINDFIQENGVIVVFSCNTCPFVVGNEDFKGWEKDYNSLYKRAKDANIGFVLLNSNEAKREKDDSFNEMVKHAKENKYKMSYFVDENSVIANKLGAKTTPHVYILNAKKELIYKGSIDNSWDSSRKEDKFYLLDIITEIKNKQKISISETEPRGCSIKRKK